MPQPRTPAQIEAARRNGSRSRGPVTAEGKARSSQNALKHGLRAKHHLVLPDEDGTAYASLLAALLAEHRPATTLETDLTRQLAATMWKQDRADRLETEQLQAPPTDDVAHHARLDALRRHHARLGREQSRVLGELHRLRREALNANEPAATRHAKEPGGRAGAVLPANKPGAAIRPAANQPGSGPVLRANEPRQVTGSATAAVPPNEPGPVSRQHRRWLERQARKAARRR